LTTSHPWRWAILVFVAAAIVYTWPLVTNSQSVLAAPYGPGDPYLNVWILGWDLHTLVSSPLAFVTGRVFDANIFYPATKTLAYSDHLLLPAMVIAPVFLLTQSVVLCYNLVLLLSLVASALAMFALARALTGSTLAALAAGLVWGFCPFHFAFLSHLQLQGMYLLPLAFLFLHRLMATARRMDAVWLGLAAGLQAVVSVEIGLIGALGLVVGAVALAVVVGHWRSAVMVRRVLLALVVGCLTVAPVVWPYLVVQRTEGVVWKPDQTNLRATTPGDYLHVPSENLLYGRTGLLRTSASSGMEMGSPSGSERELFVGFMTMGLGALAVWHVGWRRRRMVVWPFVALIVFGFALSLGQFGGRPMGGWLDAHIFGFEAIPTPACFAILVAFGCAVLGAFGLTAITGRRPRLACVLLGLMAIEYANAPFVYVAAPSMRTPVGQWLKDESGPGAVVCVPLGLGADNTPCMIESLEHRRPIVNGDGSRWPAFFPHLVDALRQFPAADALWTLRDLNVRFVVSPDRLTSQPNPTPLVERARFGRRTIYELIWTPEIEEGLERADTPEPPPAPATRPFDPGETARYRLTWSGGATMALSAGDLEFSVMTPSASFAQSGETLQFEVSFVTAPWVSGFYDARGRFTSLTRADLLPTLQVQELREGRRILNRSAWFDPARREVRTADGSADQAKTGTVRPLAIGARDPVTAFYYARAYPLTVGSVLRIPVNDFGRSLIIELRAGGEDSITAEGKTQVALRVDCRMERRVDGGRSPRMTLWISRDARRIPLALDIEAPFGSIRAELSEYRAAPAR